MPRTVRVGITLIAIALALDVLRILSPEGRTSSAGLQVAILIFLFGGLLVAIAYRHNWARVTFALLYVVALPFSIIAMSRAAAVAPRPVALSIVLAVVQVVGLACLFLPQSSAWYHNRGRAA